MNKVKRVFGFRLMLSGMMIRTGSNAYLKRKIRKIQLTIFSWLLTPVSQVLWFQGIAVPQQEYASSALEKYLKPNRGWWYHLAVPSLSIVMEVNQFLHRWWTNRSFDRPFTASDLYLALRDRVAKRQALDTRSNAYERCSATVGAWGPDFVLIQLIGLAFKTQSLMLNRGLIFHRKCVQPTALLGLGLRRECPGAGCDSRCTKFAVLLWLFDFHHGGVHEASLCH